MREIIPLLITLLASGCWFLYRDRIRPVKHLFRRDPVLRDAAYGLSELRLPLGWRAAKELNDAAGIEVVDPLRGRYAMVFSEWRDNFDSAYTLEQFSLTTRGELTSSVDLLATAGPELRTVGGLRAIQYEIEAVHDRTYIKYLHTAVEGRRAFHQVLAWAPRRSYDRPAFDVLLAGFRETLGEDVKPQSHQPRPAPRRIGFR